MTYSDGVLKTALMAYIHSVVKSDHYVGLTCLSVGDDVSPEAQECIYAMARIAIESMTDEEDEDRYLLKCLNQEIAQSTKRGV